MQVLTAAEEAAEGGVKLQQQPILDMRGPQARCAPAPCRLNLAPPRSPKGQPLSAAAVHADRRLAW